MILNLGLNMVRDLITGASALPVDTGRVGSSGTTPTINDTGLGSVIGSSDKALTYVSTDRQILFEYNLLSTDCNGETIREFGMHDGVTLFNRQTFYDLVKDSTKEVNISVVIRIIPE